MEITQFTRDPMPDAQRGTLEYAASAGGYVSMVRMEMTLREARAMLDIIEKIGGMGHDAELPLSLLWLSSVRDQLARCVPSSLRNAPAQPRE